MIQRAIDEIPAVTRQAGYVDADYRLVLQTYPVAAMYAARRGAYGCTGAAGVAPGDMVLRPLG